MNRIFSKITAGFWQRWLRCTNDLNSTARIILDAGYCASVAIILLQISTAYMPIGETRDRLQYGLVVGWAVLYLAIGILLRTYAPAWRIRGRHIIIASKLALTVYAFAVMTRYFIMPLLQLNL